MEKISQNAPGGGLTAPYPPLVLDSLEPIPVRLDFRLAVAHNLAKRHFTENIIVRAIANTGETGYGECVPRAYITGETPQSVLAVLAQLRPQFEGCSFSSPAGLIKFLTDIVPATQKGSNPAARCCLELALLDLAGKHWNVSISSMLGIDSTPEPLNYSMVIPFLPDKALAQFLDMVAEYEFSQIKIKVDTSDPAPRIRLIRERLGADVELRVDTNCAWTRETAPGFMHALAELGVVSVEQPLAADDLEGMARLREPGFPAITLDESVSTVADIEHAAAMGSADIVNIRVSKCGGLISSLKMIETAVSHGIGVQLGAQVGESCILSAAGAHLAAGTPSFRWLEGCFGGHLLALDLCRNEFKFAARGLLTPPAGNGLGITIETELLDKAASEYHKHADGQHTISGPCPASDWRRK